MSAQSVGILPNNEVALFRVPCYTIDVLSSGGGIDLRIGVRVYHSDWTMPKPKATPKQLIA